MKNKKFLKRLSAMITALCIMIPLSTALEIGTVNSADFDVIDTYNSWQEAYRDELLSFMYSNSYVEPYEDYSGRYFSSYTLCDLNNDDIPELIINANPITYAANYIYTFYNSQVVSLVDGMSLGSTISFCADEQLIEIIGAAGSSHFNRFARINNGQLEIIDNFIYGPGAAGKAYYTRNGNEISEKEFEQFKSKYDAKSWEDINIWNSNSFDDLNVEKNGLTYDYYFDYYQASEYNGTATTLTIPDTVNGLPVTILGHDLLFDNTTVDTINLSSNLQTFYFDAFNSEKLSSISVNSNNPDFTSIDGVLYDKDCSILFKVPPAKDISSFTIPTSVYAICNYAFSWCSKLKQITIPETVTYIEKDSFFWCPNLSSVTILNSDCGIYYSDTTFCNSYSDDEGHYLGVIRGYEGSTAQEFAESQDITFISLGEDPSKVTTTTTTTNTTTSTTTTTTTTASTTTTTKSTTTTFTSTAKHTTTITTTTLVSTTLPITTLPVATSTASEKIEYTLGDVNEDSSINASDATLVLVNYSLLSTGEKIQLTESQQKAADVNGDGKIDASDATMILQYYSYLSTGGKDSFADFLKK